MPQRIAIGLVALALLLAASSHAEGFTATLTLDGMSFVSFGDREAVPLPSGSTLVFRFESESPAGGSTRFTIAPGDVDIPSIPLRGGRSLRYGLARPAKGVLRVAGGERVLEFTAAVTATLAGDPRTAGTFTYTMPFTTERASATNRAGSRTLTVSGARIAPGADHVQLVGATANEAHAFPEPGAAVYTVLSGSFDRLPGMTE